MADPRLRDVADRAGVSMATASYVLRSAPGARISAETRTRVRHAAEEVGYRARAPHVIAGAVVLVLPDDAEQVVPGLVTAVSVQGWARGLATVLVPQAGTTASEAAAALRGEGLRTIGIVHVAHGREPAEARACEPTVVVDLAHRTPVPAQDRTVVVPDDRHAARQLAQALRRAGHDDVALVTEDRQAHLVALWRDGLAEVLHRQVPVIEQGCTSPAGAMPPRRHALHASHRPAALICLAEPSPTLLEELRAERRHHAVEDVTVVVRGGSVGAPPGTGFLRVPFPVTELARAALEALDRSSGTPSGAHTRVGQLIRVRFPAESLPTVPLPVTARLHTVEAAAPAV